MEGARPDEQEPDGPGDERELDGDEGEVARARVGAPRPEDAAPVDGEPNRPDDERERERRAGEGEQVPGAAIAAEAPRGAHAVVETRAEGEVDGDPVDHAADERPDGDDQAV